MSLRWRLAIATLGIAIVLAIAIAIAFSRVIERGRSDAIATLVQARFAALGGDTWCAENSSASGFSVPSPWAARRGPPLDRQPAEEVEVRLVSDTATMMLDDALLVPLSETMEHCAYGRVPIGFAGRPSLPLPLVAGPVLLAVLAVVVGVGPVIRRTRALTVAVRQWERGARPTPPADEAADELGELARSFASAAATVDAQRERIEDRERDLREFVENTSHDLATPLSVLQGHLAALEADPTPETARQAMAEARYMGSLLENLAINAKLDAGDMTRGRIDLGALVERVVDRYRGAALRRSIELAVLVPDDPVVVHADPTFSERALTNLVGNAVQHNRVGGHVAVLVDALASSFVIRILDDGPGLLPDECRRVLRRGQRGNNPRTRGRGLGLSIVSRVCAAQGWGFELVPREHQGLQASLTGPRATAGHSPRQFISHR